MLEVLILSLIQGITEFMPVSSSSHLIIISEYLKLNEQNLTLDVSLHIGSFIAVMTYFYKDIINFLKNKELFFKILISSIPVMIFGIILVETNLINALRNIKTIGWMTLVFGIILFISDKFKLNKDLKKDFSFKTAITIGFFQVLSLIPGVSRSGITITAARVLNFKRLTQQNFFFTLYPNLRAVSIFG